MRDLNVTFFVFVILVNGIFTPSNVPRASYWSIPWADVGASARHIRPVQLSQNLQSRAHFGVSEPKLALPVPLYLVSALAQGRRGSSLLSFR